jgi:hypothetical protein
VPDPIRILAGLVCLALAFPPMAAAQDSPKTIVAAAVRDAGYTCKEPRSVKPDAQASSSDEKAWIIQCETANYRVKFMGDKGAKIEVLRGP